MSRVRDRKREKEDEREIESGDHDGTHVSLAVLPLLTQPLSPDVLSLSRCLPRESVIRR